MKKLGFLLLATVASTNALASEVGATFPQLANSPALMAVAIAETGASVSLAIEPDSDVKLANQHLPLERYVDNAYNEVTKEIEMKVLQELSQYKTTLAVR